MAPFAAARGPVARSRNWYDAAAAWSARSPKRHRARACRISCAVPPRATPPIDFAHAYSSGSLDDFFEVAPGDLERALALPRPPERAALVAALRRHALALGAPAPVLANLERLAHPEARAVVTGQQTGLLLGPTYSLSKAMTAIALAKRLDSEERPVVPVFWLATQDHDAHEMDNTYLLDASETLRRISVTLPEGVAVGRVPLTKELVAEVAAGLATLTPAPRFRRSVWELLEGAASSVATYSDWFAALFTRLLGDAGLVLIDPLRPDVAEQFVPIIERELADPLATPAAINAAGRRLKELGYEPQLGRAQGATNLFVESDGKRLLLRATAGGFMAEDERFTRADLMALLAADPTAITPAAGLRPVTQDFALPTAVFVLGPGELRYVSQLKDVYRFHGVPMPLAWQRATATVIEPVTARLLAGLGISAASFRARRRELQEQVLLERHGHAERFRTAAGRIEAELEGLLTEVDGIDPTLAGTVKRGRRYLEETLARLRGKTSAALAARDEVTTRQFDRLAAHLLPLGQPAERVLSPFSHALKFGIEPLMDRFATLAPEHDQELFL